MAFKVDTYHLKLKFTSTILGTQPQKDVAERWITTRFAEREAPANRAEGAGGAPVAAGTFPAVEGPDIPLNGDGLPTEELAGLQQDLERGTTAFFRNDEGYLCLAGYQVKGGIKEAAAAFNGMNNVKNQSNKVNRYVFVQPELIVIWGPDGQPYKEPPQYNGRPLRGQTAQGPRTSLARSEEVPAGCTIECDIKVLSINAKAEIDEEQLRDLLDYWQFMGLGQWRSGGHGQTEYTLEKTDESLSRPGAKAEKKAKVKEEPEAETA